MTEPVTNIDQKKALVFNNVDQLLSTVTTQRRSYASNFWVPSLKRDVRFTEIDTNQQKRLIKSIVDSPVYNTEFILTIYDILKENCLDTDVNLDSLTIVDKLLILLGLRISSVGGALDVDITIEEGKPTKSVSIDLIKVYEIAKTTLTNITPIVLKDDIFYVECSVPTIKTEILLEREMRAGKNNSIEIEDIKQLRETISEALINEVVKYISKVSVVVDGTEQAVTWDNFSFTDRMKIVGKFSSKLLQGIISYINAVKAEVNKIEVVHFRYEDKDQERRLTFDGSFFMPSYD